MLGTIIGSDLTWNGSKGCRSKSRRAKKSVLKGCGKLVNKKPETLDMPVSESEKLGVSVLGCRFSEREEHVPIKKRRFMYRSPSPPPRSPSPHSGENETERPLKIKLGVSDCTACANDSGQIVDKDCDGDETNLVRVNRQVVENEDFSGISILAAAACSKGLGGEGGHTEESSGVEESYLREGPFEVSTNNESLSVSKGVSKDDISSTEMSTEGTSCISAVPQEEIIACLRIGDFSANNLSNRNNVEDKFVQDHPVAVSKDLLINREEERKQEFSSRELRLHWDLNTDMDSWKYPFDYESADSKTNVTIDIVVDGGHVNKMRNLEGYELQSCLDDKKTIADKELPHIDSREMAREMKQSTIEETKSELENLHSSELGCAVKMDQFKGKETLDSKERISIGGSSPSGSQAEKQEVASEVALSSNLIGEMSGALNRNVDETKDISCSSEEPKFRKDMDALETRPPLNMGPLDSVTDNSVCSFSGVEMPTSGASIEAQPASAVDLKVQHNKVYAHDSSETDAKLREPEVDYDSQYEDGEVRESIFHAWEEYDGEDMDVDYGSDNASNMGYEAQNIMKNTQESNFQPSLSGSSGSVKERPLKGKDGWNEVASGDETGPYKVIRDVCVVPREDGVKKPSVSADSTLKISGWSCRNFSDTLTGLKEDSYRKNLSADDTKVRMVRSRECRRELQSCIEGRPVHDVYSKVKTCMQGSSEADNPTSRVEREPEYVESFGRGRYNYHSHARYQGDDHWVSSADGHRGIRRYHSPNYHGQAPFRRSGPEDGSIGRQRMDASSFGDHRRLARSGSTVDGEEAFRFRSGFRPSRELSPGRRVSFGRGRSPRYGPRMDGRGSRGRYHRPMPDDCSEPFLNHSYFSTRRERCFSPIDRRGEGHAHRSHSKSPSRSRTRSPNSSNPSLRHRSKSPNFKSDTRMQRMRSPNQRPGLSPDRMLGYRTMRRTHGSPPHNSRWIGDRRNGAVHFRDQGFNQRSSVLDRRSPGRFGPQDDRFDLDSPRNYRSMHRGRFSKIDRVGRGGRLRHDGSEDNGGENSYRFGQVPPAKRNDIDGDVKRFRNTVDDGFVKAHNSHFDDASAFNDRQDIRNLAGEVQTTCQEDLEKRDGHSHIKESENMLVQNHM